jgi:hypothetical protein
MRILFVSSTHAGPMHDKTIADSTPYPLPEGSYLMQDLGFLGFDLKGVTIIMPAKKPRAGELTPDEKELNREVSSLRVRIEHVVSGIKRCRIVKDRIRLLREGVRDLVMEVCCALHNFRLRLRPWKALV